MTTHRVASAHPAAAGTTTAPDNEPTPGPMPDPGPASGPKAVPDSGSDLDAVGSTEVAGLAPYVAGPVRDVPAAGTTDEAPKQRREPLREQLSGRLLGLITSGEYVAGDHLPERQLAERFGVSRGPVRDAIRVLERDGWVSLRPGRGAFVRTLTDDEVDDLYEARMVVEAASARLAAIRVPSTGCPELYATIAEAEELLAGAHRTDLLSELTIRFHHQVSRMSGNGFLIEFSDRMRTMSRRIVVPLVPRIAPAAWREHAAIANAIRTGDAQRAEDLMRDHLRWSRRVYRQACADAQSAPRRRELP